MGGNNLIKNKRNIIKYYNCFDNNHSFFYCSTKYIIVATKIMIILGLTYNKYESTSLISSQTKNNWAPNFLATERTYLALFSLSASESPKVI